MWSIAGIIAATAVIALLEAPALWRNRWRKELWMFSLLLLFGTGLSIAISLHAPVPNPLDWITAVYKPISGFLQ